MQKKSGVHSSRKKRNVLGKKEKRRLVQLILCVGLFLVVLAGKGIAPSETFQAGSQLLHLIRQDTDFQEVFSIIGEAAAGEPVWNQLVQLFEQEPEQQETNIDWEGDGPAVLAVKWAVRQLPTQETLLEQISAGIVNQEPTEEGQKEEEETVPDQTEGAEQSNDLEGQETGEEQSKIDTEEPRQDDGAGEAALPAGVSTEYYDLGLSTVMTPVVGQITSAYGYRNDPISGEYSFHKGVDISAAVGTSICAFADGSVEFVGESESYGLYIQLDHGNGVKTFYCHCSELCVQKGAWVAAGQVIAKTGDTGNTTGPHLHLEVEKDGLQLNPAYYIQSEG